MATYKPYGTRLTGFGSRLAGLFRAPGPLPKASPYREAGVSGTQIYGGLILQKERDVRLVGPQKWITFSDLITNTSIVASGMRYMFNLITYSSWSVEPADESDEAKQIADFIEEVIDDTATPWKRISRRASMYRFHGFGIQEWTAKKRDDGKVGLDDVEARPQHTIERWEPDDNGSIVGVWQRSPMGGELLYLPRSKIMYMVDDSMTDSPEGLGLLRHLIEPWERLKRYFELEGRGFERDLRGIPVGRIPYTEIKKAVDAGTLTKSDASAFTSALEEFVKLQTKSNDTSICLDSAPYIVETDSGPSVSGVMQYGLELLQGGSMGFAEVGKAIERTIEEMARILGVENILLGGASSGGNRALAADKSQNFYLVVNGTLDEIAESANKDIIAPICDLNGFKEKLRPKLKHSEVSFRTVAEITAALAQMATAGAVLRPDDPAIDDVRDLLGLENQPEPSPEILQQANNPLSVQQQQMQQAQQAKQPQGQPGSKPGFGKPGKSTIGGKAPPTSKKPKPNQPQQTQPSARAGGKGSAGNQDVAKSYFDIDTFLEQGDRYVLDKSNPNQPRGYHGRFVAGFGGPGGERKPGTHDIYDEQDQEQTTSYQHKPSAFENVPGLKGKTLRTLEWLNSDPVKETVKEHGLYIAKEAIGHILSSIASAAIESKLGSQSGESHREIRSFIHNTVHHVASDRPNKSVLDYLSWGHTKTVWSLAVQTYLKLRENELNKVDETDPIIEILTALQKTIDDFDPTEGITKAYDPNEPRDESGRWSSSGGSRLPITRGRREANAALEQEYERKAVKRFALLKRLLSVTAQVAGLGAVNSAFDVVDWVKSSSDRVLKENASDVLKAGLVDLVTYTFREAAKNKGENYNPKIDKFIEKTVRGERQQRDITANQAKAAFRLVLKLVRKDRKDEIKKADMDNSDPVIVVLDYILGTLDDMDQRDLDEQASKETVAKVVRFIEDGSGVEIVAEELD